MILLMGIAGSGKGTQGKLLADKYGFHLISMGEVLRLYATTDQRQRMLAGELLKDTEIISLIDQLLASLPDNEPVLMDGFPRTIAQAKWLLDQAKSGRFRLKLAILLVASRESVKVRLLKRGRLDDEADTIEARFNEYERATKPLISWLKQNGLRVAQVDGERPVETVHQDLSRLVEELKKA